VKALDPEFEVLPVARTMLQPILERELAGFATSVERALPDAAAAYARLVANLPKLLEQWLQQSAADQEPKGVS
jgi:hypothetical protein